MLACGLLCAVATSPANASVVDVPTAYTQFQQMVNGFVAKAQAGSSAQTEVGFLSLDSVKGSATDPVHKGQITVLYAQDYVLSVGGAGSVAGKAAPSDYYLVIPIDQSAPVLEQAAASGQQFSEAKIFFRSIQFGQPVDIATDTLGTVRVSMFWKTTTSSPSFPNVAVVGLQYQTAEWAFGTTKAGRDFSANRNL